LKKDLEKKISKKEMHKAIRKEERNKSFIMVNHPCLKENERVGVNSEGKIRVDFPSGFIITSYEFIGFKNGRRVLKIELEDIEGNKILVSPALSQNLAGSIIRGLNSVFNSLGITIEKHSGEFFDITPDSNLTKIAKETDIPITNSEENSFPD
jgi:hypothetical protein